MTTTLISSLLPNNTVIRGEGWIVSEIDEYEWQSEMTQNPVIDTENMAFRRGRRAGGHALDAMLHAFNTLAEGSNDWHQNIKPHPLDKKYPHVCFECKKPLKFEELFQANTKDEYYKFGGCFNMPLYRRLKKLWRSQIIEFYCCNCYKLQIIW